MVALVQIISRILDWNIKLVVERLWHCWKKMSRNVLDSNMESMMLNVSGPLLQLMVMLLFAKLWETTIKINKHAYLKYPALQKMKWCAVNYQYMIKIVVIATW